VSDLKENLIFPSVYVQVNHWYYLTKLKLVRRLISNHLDSYFDKAEPINCLDIGAGNGIMSEGLTHIFPKAKSFEIFQVDSAYTTADLEAAPMPQITRSKHPLSDRKYDIIIAIDVLEHINDQELFLAGLKNLTKPNTLIIITVPAFSWLWSPHDDYLNHYRRYTRQSLLRSCQILQAIEIDSGYLYSALLPLVALVTSMKRAINKLNDSCSPAQTNMFVPARPVNRLLNGILRIEQKIKSKSSYLARLAGSTAYVAMRIPEHC